MMYFLRNDLDCPKVAIEHGNNRIVAIMSNTSLRARSWWASCVNFFLNCWGSKGRIETHDIKNSIGRISVPHGIFSNTRSVATLWYECENKGKVSQSCIMSLFQ